MIPVIISGGSGSRLWPVSRQLDPKPFIRLADGNSLLQNTCLRNVQLKEKVETILTVTNHKLYHRMASEYQELELANINYDFVLEPFPRNTAAAISAAVLFAKKHYSQEDILLILPADHLITNLELYNQAINNAVKLAKEGYLVTFGINPTYPETGYGYIEVDTGKKLDNNGYMVKRFVEKPNLETATNYINSGKYKWNSGMFCGQVSAFLSELALYAPNILSSTEACVNHSEDVVLAGNKVMNLNSHYFIQAEDISIDYALFEKSEKVAVVPCSIAWSDIGSWLSIAEVTPKDENHNSIIGEVILHKVNNSLLYSTDRIIAGVDIDNLVIVDTPDALLVANKDSSQEVKKIFEELKTRNHKAAFTHLKMHYEWGSKTLIDENPLYTINQLEIKPGAELALSFSLKEDKFYKSVVGEAWLYTLHGKTLLTTTNFMPLTEADRLIKNNNQQTLLLLEFILAKL